MRRFLIRPATMLCAARAIIHGCHCRTLGRKAMTEWGILLRHVIGTWRWCGKREDIFLGWLIDSCVDGACMDDLFHHETRNALSFETLLNFHLFESRLQTYTHVRAASPVMTSRVARRPEQHQRPPPPSMAVSCGLMMMATEQGRRQCGKVESLKN